MSPSLSSVSPMTHHYPEEGFRSHDHQCFLSFVLFSRPITLGMMMGQNILASARSFFSRAHRVEPSNVSALTVSSDLGLLHLSPRQFFHPFHDSICCSCFGCLIVSVDVAVQGLVETAVRMKQWDLAVQKAKEVVDRMPRNPKALRLVGFVLSHTTATRAKSIRAYRRALHLDPLCATALIELTALHAAAEEYQEAATVLKKYIRPYRSAFLHVRLAEYLTQLQQVEEANQNLQTALLFRQAETSASEKLVQF